MITRLDTSDFSPLFHQLKAHVEGGLRNAPRFWLDPIREDGLLDISPKGTISVYLPPEPSVLMELTAAHELLHLQLSKEGFLAVRPVRRGEEFELMASFFNSMFEDPVVCRRMETFGFNVTPKYRFYFREAKKEYAKVSEMPSPSQWLAYCWCVFASVVTLVKLPQPCRQELEEFLSARFPAFWPRPKMLLNRLIQAELDDPERMEELMIEIRSEFRLEQILRFDDLRPLLLA